MKVSDIKNVTKMYNLERKFKAFPNVPPDIEGTILRRATVELNKSVRLAGIASP